MDSINNCFTKRFLSKYPSLEVKTIETLLNNGYFSKETLMLLDLDKDLPLLSDINMAQKSVLRHVLYNLQKSEKFSIELENNLSNNSKDKLKPSIDCPKAVVFKEENDCELIDIIYDSDIEVIDESNDCLKSRPNNSVAQENERQMKRNLQTYGAKQTNKRQTHPSLSLSPALLMHERINSGEKSYERDYKNCGKRFTQLVQIEVHKRIHTKRKPYGCRFDECGRRFQSKYHLLCHVSCIHQNERPYICSLDGCNRRFALKANLLKHSLIHWKKIME
jgi:uncharacterized Zn-finger protein